MGADAATGSAPSPMFSGVFEYFAESKPQAQPEQVSSNAKRAARPDTGSGRLFDIGRQG